jgi:flotillin
MNAIVMLAIFATILLFSFLLLLLTRYRRCSSNQILVVYGRVGGGQSSKCLHGGGAFVWPLIQNYAYLGLEPLQIEIPLSGALSAENIRVSVPSVFTVAIGTEPELMNSAAVRLLGLTRQQIVEQARDIIFGQLRQVIAGLRIDHINRDRDTFRESIKDGLEPELRKIGLVLINVNIHDITDESGYIEAIGRKAASEAIQQAVIDVAEQQKRGAIGVAEAERERAVSVANAERDREIGVTRANQEKAIEVAGLERDRIVGEQRAEMERQSAVKEAEQQKRVRVADADAQAVEGENKARARVVGANAELQVRESEAMRLSETKRREAEASVQQAGYIAQTAAALELAKKIEAEKRAEVEATAKAEKARIIVEAEGEAEKTRIQAEAAAGAVYAKLDAEARGNAEILRKKAEAMRELISATGGADKAFQMMMLEHVDHLAETASKAIQNIKFDKVVVWDGNGGDGKGATANFLRSMAGSLPPVLQMMRDIGGVEMPEYLGRIVDQPSSPKDPTDTPPKA